MPFAIIINSIVCSIGAILGLFFAAGSIISIANMKVPWVGALLIAALLIPVTFVVSGVGAWLANGYGASQVVTGLIALPWIYAVCFVVVMVVSLKA
ncbi:hypothetical protein [uncultured Thiodictyon sp.]|uniref:hypothetical protein n=1 Tax=uncultured Thiodictyon sp. TaxID=1846217 RepID=UPI0025F47F4C|nr:hypothetical protein [uncultured Thiodictyon sp.]